MNDELVNFGATTLASEIKPRVSPISDCAPSHINKQLPVKAFCSHVSAN
jgi:hypothetical protein